MTAPTIPRHSARAARYGAKSIRRVVGYPRGAGWASDGLVWHMHPNGQADPRIRIKPIVGPHHYRVGGRTYPIGSLTLDEIKARAGWGYSQLQITEGG